MFIHVSHILQDISEDMARKVSSRSLLLEEGANFYGREEENKKQVEQPPLPLSLSISVCLSLSLSL